MPISRTASTNQECRSSFARQKYLKSQSSLHLLKRATMKILPQPQKSENISGSFCIRSDCRIFCESLFKTQAERLVNMVYESSGIVLQFTDVIEEAQILFVRDEQYDSEAYTLMISEGVATVTCATNAGCFYAMETLRQILHLDSMQEEISCANCYVEDNPKFNHRGLMLDISRHFFNVDTLKQIVELMSQVKLNKLHLHLSDDQGFRIQIDKYPLLNEISSNRGGSEVVKDGQSYVDDVPHGGFLSKKDVCALVEYASARNVEIIPEIDIPGHLVAALAAYPEFSCTGQVSEVRKSWGVSKVILCAGNDGSYQFIKDILDEICELFPSEHIHLGGDKAPKDRWCNCKLCRERMAELKLDDFDELQTYMIETFRRHLEEKGKKVICWNDGLTRSADSEIVAQVWTSKKRSTKKQIRHGRKIIVSTRTRANFNPDYKRTPLNKTLRLNPFRGVKRSARGSVLGVEGTLFTEYIDTKDRLYFQLLPRLDALAEVAWGNGKKQFYKCLNQRLALYDKLQLNYNKQYSNKTGNTNK